MLCKILFCHGLRLGYKGEWLGGLSLESLLGVVNPLFIGFNVINSTTPDRKNTHKSAS